MYHVLIAAGGTGGHIIPAQVVAEDLFKEGVSVSFAAHGLSENRFFNKERFCFHDISAAPLSLLPFGGLKFLCYMSMGVFSSLPLLREIDLVISFGSYHAFPVILAAYLKKTPFVFYEANAVSGRVIRLFSSSALWTACPFEEGFTKLRGETKVVEPILRRYLREPPSLENAKDYFGLPFQIPTILVMGGSQGAKTLNMLMPKVLSLFCGERKLSVIHLAGSKEDLGGLRKKYEDLGILATVKAFEHRMENALVAADVVISRSGASAVAEIEAFQKPAIYIPFPYSTDSHQKKNAFLASCRGKASVIEETEASPDIVFSHLVRWLYAQNKNSFTSRKRGHFVTMILKTLHTRCSYE